MPKPVRPQVLYVEDHPINALLMAAIFERRPQLELLTASHGEEAMQRAEGLRPVLLLLDLGLPDCHGSQLLGWLRALPGCAEPPAVAVTADITFDIADSGFCELWAKPLHVEHVLARLDALTGACATPPPQLPRELLTSCGPAPAGLTPRWR